MTPAEKVAHGLALAAEGMGELRIEQERLLSALETNRATLVGGEHRALALRFQAHRARRRRHLQPGEVSRPAPPLFDGLRSDALPDARTLQHLATMRLVPTPRPEPQRETLLDRLLGRRVVPVLCPSCLASPCTCSPRRAALPSPVR